MLEGNKELIAELLKTFLEGSNVRFCSDIENCPHYTVSCWKEYKTCSIHIQQQQKVRKNELMYLAIGVSLCAAVLGGSVYQVYFSYIEYTIEFQVFETNPHFGKSKTQILTRGMGKFYFIGDWTGQFIEGHTYQVTYVQKSGYADHTYDNLVVLEWEEIV